MIYRQALTDDIAQLQRIRNSVTENVLTNPSLVTVNDYIKYITLEGKGWLCQVDSHIVGFAIVDLLGHNIWALFVDPHFDKQGIGRQLHDLMLQWYFEQTTHTVWLSTEVKSRAEKFYRSAGWTEAGLYGKSEIKFEMSFTQWDTLQRNA
ncbi:MAG: GNAT family N-acetyltransferase [Bacteroidia bacterium]|nr:GNAT family N-acetyltransferase [Bacteroidia bacterium]